MAYRVAMILIETPFFTREISRLLPDEAYRQLQKVLAESPEAGDVIVGSGGLRVIYYWHVPDAIFLLYPFKKNEAENLTKEQILVLKKVVKEWLL